MNSSWLFEWKGKKVGVRDLEKALHLLGVKKGDVIFVHSGLRAFGNLGPGYTKPGLCAPIVRSLKKNIGTQGTLVMPTFTYAFCKEKKFDLKKSPSEVGALTEFFRNQRGVIRSAHPIFSVAASGAKAKQFTKVGTDSYGDDSFFAHLLKVNGIILLMGSAKFSTATFYHFIEQAHAVPYRFMKTFRGTLVDGAKKHPIAVTFFVRPLDGSVDNDVSRLEKILRKKKLLREVRVGAASIAGVRAQDFYREGMQLLDRDIYGLLKSPPKKKR